MRFQFVLTLFISILSISVISAQQDYTVRLHSGHEVFPENVKENLNRGVISDHESVEDFYYRMVQFYEMPSNAIHQRLKNLNIELLEYIPNKTYIAAIPTQFDLAKLEGLGVRSFMEIHPNLKLSDDLQNEYYPDWATHRRMVRLMLKYYKNLSQTVVKEFCLSDGINVLKSNEVNNFMEVSVPIDKVMALAELPYIAFLELTPPPSVPDDTPGRALHRANAIDTQFPSGRKYTGEGVDVLTRDDGTIGPHIDFQGRLDQTFCDPSFGSHGDGVSGIFAGAGNLNPRMRGMAAGAFLHTIEYDATFLDETMQLFFDENVLVTNSSYSNFCNAGYTETTETVDQQVFDNPTLLHVFSAGNSNNQDCGYGAGNQWGNITGGHKQGKNVIATANLLSDATLVNSSSRGPAHDGRIKPDIAANGNGQFSTDPNNDYSAFSGTSAAAPGIAGVTAMLHNAYRANNGGETASSGLLKAILLNTANDLGNAGPDFKYGWGHVNAYRAALTIEEERYTEGVVSPGATNQFTLEIPEGVVQAKIMTYWMDQPGTVMTDQALVNNIDTWVESPAGIHNPWVLNSTPHPDSLDLPATTGVDDLNNMEQVAIANPAAGTYTLNISGAELPFGDHAYYIIWEFRFDEITVIYPIGGESMAPTESERIYWDAAGTGGEFVIEYSNNNGMNWNFVNVVGGGDRWYDWDVPNEITGEALIRISRNGVEDTSDDKFNIMRIPTNVSVTQVCPTFIRVTWNATQNAASYDVWVLGEKYMELVGSANSPTFDIPIDNPFQEHWVAVSANATNGAKSRRSIAINYAGGLLNCQQNNDLALLEIIQPTPSSGFECASPFTGQVKIEVNNNGIDNQSNIIVAYQLDNNPPIVETISNNVFSGQSVDYTFDEGLSIAENGVYTLKTWTALDGETSPYDDTLTTQLTVYVELGVEPEISEDFEMPFPMDYWNIDNPDNNTTWNQVTVIGINDEPGRAIVMPYFNYDAPGEEDAFWTIPIDLSNVSENMWLFFDVAHAQFNGNSNDGLKVEISIDCGNSFLVQPIWEKYGNDLATTNSTNGSFFPNEGSDWRTEFVDLSTYAGLDKIILRFVGVNDYGNNLYVDNINIKEVTPPVANFIISDDAPCRFDTITYTDASEGGFLSWAWNFGSAATTSNSIEQGPHEVSYILFGDKNVRLIVSNPLGSDTLIQVVNVRARPSGTFSHALIGPNEVQFTHNTNGAFNFFWEFGDGVTSIEENPIHLYDNADNYEVKLTVTNDCGERLITNNIIVTNSLEVFQDVTMMILPNPNNGIFEIFLENVNGRALSFELINLEGKMLQREVIEKNMAQNIVKFEQPNLPAGLYFVKIQEKDQVKTIRIVVE